MSLEEIRIFALPGPRIKRVRALNIFTVLALLLGILAGAGVVLLNQPFYILAGVVGLLIFIAALFSEEFGLLVLIFISYTRLSDILIEYHGLISFAKPFLAVLIATIFLRWALFGKQPEGWLRPVILFGLAAIVGLFSLFYSPVPELVWDRLIENAKDALIAIVIVVLLQRGQSFRRVMWTLIILGIFMGTLSVFQYFTKTFDNEYGGFAISQMHQIVGSIDDYRSTGPVGDANFFAQILVVIVPIALERFFHERKKVLRLVALWSFMVCVITIFLTYSRGGFLAMAVALMILLVFYPPRGIQIPIIIVSALIFVSLLPPYYLDRILTLQDLFKARPSLRIDEISFQGRLSENLTAVEMLRSNPLFGVGLNSYKPLFPQYSKKLGLAIVATEREAHSLYLEVAAEQGIIGLFVFILLLGTCFQTLLQARRKFSRQGMKDYSGMVTAFLAGWVGYLVAALYIHNGFPRYYYVVMGLALSVHMVAKNTLKE